MQVRSPHQGNSGVPLSLEVSYLPAIWCEAPLVLAPSSQEVTPCESCFRTSGSVSGELDLRVGWGKPSGDNELLCFSNGISGGSGIKNPPANAGDAGDTGSILGWEDTWRRKWQSTPVFLPAEPHGQRSLAGFSPRGCRVGPD